MNNAVSPDTNTFPTDLIERVDIVTGGDSAVYGSDAIAGVVNFILKDHYQGLELRGQGAVSEQGLGGSYYASLLAGKNFAGDRGNVAINAEFAHASDFYASEDNNLNHLDQFVSVDTNPPGLLNGSNGIPDRTFFRDVRSVTTSNGGLVRFGTRQCGKDKFGKSYRCTFLFQPDGTLVPQTGTRIGLAPNGSIVGGNGATRREGDQVGLSPRVDRYAINLIGHFEITPALVPFVEAKFVRTDTLGSSSGPAFFNGGAFNGDPREQPRLDNPFLSTQAHDLIVSQLVAANGGVASDYTGDTQFTLRENLLGLGVRQEQAQRDTYRIVAGLKGVLSKNLRYEVSANYGEFHEPTRVLGNLNVQRFVLALDSTRDPNGNIVCRSRIDSAAAFGYANATGTPSEIASILATDVATCVPINPFGEGNISRAARNYVISDTVSTGKITQFVANGFVSGDSGGFFKLPGGPIGFSLGAEYRRETNSYQEGRLVEQGYTFYNALPTFHPPAFEVTEGFGELRVPLLADKRFFHELTLSGAGRVAGYKGSTGIVYAYNGGVDWAPVRD